MNGKLNDRKDELAQVYYKSTTQEGTEDVHHRHFIYSRAKKEAGGLYVNARDLASSEKVNNSVGTNIRATQFIFNRNDKINEMCKIIYRGVVFDVYSVDMFDMRSMNMKVIAKENTDTTVYGDDEYEE